MRFRLFLDLSASFQHLPNIGEEPFPFVQYVNTRRGYVTWFDQLSFQHYFTDFKDFGPNICTCITNAKKKNTIIQRKNRISRVFVVTKIWPHHVTATSSEIRLPVDDFFC